MKVFFEVRKKTLPLSVSFASSRRRRAISDNLKFIPLSTNCCEDLFIGKILIGSTLNIPPEKYLKCKVTFLCVSDEVDRIHLLFDEISVVVTLIIETQLLKEIFTANVFSFQFDLIGEDLFLNTYFKELPLPKFNTKIGNALKTVFEITHKVFVPASEYTDDESMVERSEEKLYGVQEMDQLYASVSRLRNDSECLSCLNVQHAALKPLLRPYQVNAVKWLMKRENVAEAEDYLHPLYISVILPSGREVYYDKYSGHVSLDKPVVSCSSRGGILAEEMGLGKTVEFLSLILNNPSDISVEENTSVESLDSTELSNDDNEDLPIFKKQLKKTSLAKKKKLKLKEECDADDTEKPQNLSKKKSSIRLALELWYDSALKEVNPHHTKRVEHTVSCICGEIFKSGQIQCVDCEKFQHKNCLGYEEHYGDFRCPSCWLNQPLVESGATLIVTPISLRTQWCNEIKKHVDKKLRVLVYEGSNKKPVYPTYFKYFDVVITTYNVLQAEFRLTEKGQVCELRRKRKYDFQGSPISRVKWWRLCLDEAQTIDSPGRIVSEMAKKLNAHHRWAVSGTPISKDITDLFGIIDYLQMEPYNELETWKNLLYLPYLNGNTEPLCSFLSKVMWRTTKAEVVDQIGIPEQTIKEHFLEFSAVEKFFYNKEHELCSEAFVATLKNTDTSIPLVRLDKSFLKKIMVPLLSLRQVCNHPNSERGKYLATKKKVSTMKELLEALILKNTTESEEILRMLVSSHNGIAGIQSLLQNLTAAADEYRKVLQLSARFSDESKSSITVDKLQLIHAMHNLADILDQNPGIPPTLHDDTLRSDCEILEQKYIEKFINNTFSAYQDCTKTHTTIDDLQNQFILKEGQWFSDGFDWVVIHNFRSEMIGKIQSNHDIAFIQCPIDLSCEKRTLYFVANWNEEIIEYRAELMNKMNRLFTYKEEGQYKIIVDQKVVELATDCHLRVEDKDFGKKKVTKKKCPLCVADDFIKKYECKLFQKTKRAEVFDDMSLQGTWQPTSQEIILKTLNNLLKARNAPIELVQDGTNHMNLLDNMKKEFKEIRKLWTTLHNQISAQDELDMCKTKFRLEDPSVKEKNKTKNSALKQLSYLIESKVDGYCMLNEHELDHRMMVMKSEQISSLSSLEKNLGVESYLETLRKQQYEDATPEPCPICTNVLEQHWSILPCGHSYCMECLHNLFRNAGGPSINCCVCRQSILVQDISYMRSTATDNEDSDFEVKGNFSTKIEATIKLIMNMRQEDENVKVLVFSSWPTVLKFLKDALGLNEIKSEILLPSKLEERVERFKDEKEKITVLLLPISLGGKGLNLIEATHVILMEPLLNPGEELQAIGRVHRIGQTKPTFVHKLCIKNTIEESILTATNRDADKWDRNKVTLEQLKQLFEKVQISEITEDKKDLSTMNGTRENC